MAPALAAGIRTAVGVPISVEGRLWGVMNASSTAEEPLSADTEVRLAGFTELVATAIANAQARVELRGFAEEQVALRRVATLVARGVSPEEVFAAVTAEVGRVLGVDYTAMSRYEPDGARTVVAAWARSGSPVVPVGTREILGGPNVPTLVFETGRPTRIDRYGEDAGPAAAAAVAAGVRSAVGVPIRVEGQLWGLMNVYSTHEERLPESTEARLAGFTELVATAIANAEARAALTASRARIVATADATRRHIERDLHDGAQQRLVSLVLKLRTAQATVAPDAGELAGQLDDVATGLGEALDELREIARGIHPAALAEGGLRPALKVLARRSAVPVRLDVRVDRQLPEQVELAAYYVVSEALTNAAKHAAASEVHVEVQAGQGVLRIEVRDDGRGGATFAHGSGLVGLRDRVEALGGKLSLRSQPGAGTTVSIAVSLDDGGETGPPPAGARRPRILNGPEVASVRRRYGSQRELHQEFCPLADWAVDGDGPAGRLDAVVQPKQTRAARRVGAADAVVAHGEPDGAVCRVDVDVHHGGVSVFRRVRQRLRDDVVGGDLDPFGQPVLDPHIEPDGCTGAACERLQRRPEPGLREDRRVDAA